MAFRPTTLPKPCWTCLREREDRVIDSAQRITSVNKEDLLRDLPPEWAEDLLPIIREQAAASKRKVVVLDDDPTGTQTVHNTPVLTEWSVDAIESELQGDYPAFYILTNSRSLPLPEARTLNAEIGRNLREAGKRANRDFVVVSRSDSTLRGHFPGEVEALASGLGETFDGWIVIPFFLEGGRYTVDDTHYVEEKGWLVPAAETEFARDSVFGYRSSNLRDWVEEKTAGRISSEDVVSISIEDLRMGGPEAVIERLLRLQSGKIGVVNAAGYRDVEVFVKGLLDAEARGRRFLYRSAASFVRVRAGISARPLLSSADLNLPSSGGGLTLVGSYVPKTTRQIERVLALPQMSGIELSVEAILDGSRRDAEIDRVRQSAQPLLQQEKDVMIYTSRRLITAGQAEADLSIGNRVSEALITTLQRITAKLRYLIGKGGITSSDVATKGLNVRRALVLGQILPGVPVWRLGPESRHAGIPYIVFPGNVGGDDALADTVNALSVRKK
jgi:uncharacterized protein YgbK (DUF1537 family)